MKKLKYVGYAVLGIAVAAVVGIAFRNVSHPAVPNTLVIPDQQVETSVRIARVTLSRGGYVVLTGIRYSGATGIDYLVSPYLTPGVHEGITIPVTVRLSPDSTDTYEPIEPVQPGGYLFGSLIVETQNKTQGAAYSPGEDIPAFDSSGNTVQVRFTIERDRNPYSVRDTCQAVYTTETGRCFESAFERYSQTPGFMIDVCQAVSQSDKNACYGAMGRVLKRTNPDSAFRQNICNHVILDDYITRCMGN